MLSGLHAQNGPGQVLFSATRLTSWRVCRWHDAPRQESQCHFSDRDSLEQWLLQFDHARLREIARLLTDDWNHGPHDDRAIRLSLAGLIQAGVLCVSAPQSAPFSDTLPGRPEQPAAPPREIRPPPRAPDNTDKPRIIRIEFLDGSADKALATGKQYVNLPSESKWVDGVRITTRDRLTHKPRIRVWFDRPGSHGFKVKYLAGAGNARYSAAEKGRNPRFKFQETERSYATEGNGTLILPVDDFFVTAAGDDTYRLEATDEQGNTVRSGEIRTHRLVYCLPIKMRGLTSIAPSLARFQGEYAKHAIEAVELPAVQIDHMANIGVTDVPTLEVSARGAYGGSAAPAAEPFVLAVIFTDHLAVKRASQRLIRSGVTVGPGTSKVIIPIVGPGMTNPAVNPRALWKNLVPGEGWFVSCDFTPSDAAPGAAGIPLAEARCEALPSNAANPDACRSVSIDVSALPAGTGTLTLEVNWVDRMRAGLAMSSGNAICICTRAWWRTIQSADQNDTLIHEAGHHIGMAAAGLGRQPDAIGTLYTSAKGHVGNHCHHGIPAGQNRYDGATDADLSDCVMYGASTGSAAFCANCAPAVRKADLSAGWSRF